MKSAQDREPTVIDCVPFNMMIIKACKSTCYIEKLHDIEFKFEMATFNRRTVRYRALYLDEIYSLIIVRNVKSSNLIGS